MNVSLTKPIITKKELNAAAKILKSGWLIRGKETQLFEEEVAKHVGSKYAVATQGCTMAMYLALKRYKLKPTDEVIVPSFTWSATASVVIQAGGIPVFADIDPETWCLDPEDVKRKITKNTRLVMPVHFGAQYAEGFDNFEIPVIFDAAHRLEKNDFNGIVSCHSFYAVKNMTTIRGGIVLTNSEEDANYYKMLCHGGIAKDTLSRYHGGNNLDASSFYYEIEEPGWNFDMTDVQAAIGREQLRNIENFNDRRNEIVKLYNKAFGLNRKGNHLYSLMVENRDEFLIKMRQDGIQCSIHYLPLHLMKGYKKLNTPMLPNTEFVGKRCVSIPLHAALTDEEVLYVIEKTLEHGKLTNTKKKTLTVGIPTFNEEKNIAPLIYSILNQNKKNYNLEKILVLDDCSNDKTLKIVERIAKENNKVKLISNSVRTGKCMRINQIYKMNQSDVVVTFDADIMLSDNDVLDKMVLPFKNKKVGLVTANDFPVEITNLHQRIIGEWFLLWYRVRKDFNNGDTIFNVHGNAQALKKEFAKQVVYPKGITADQDFLYLTLKKSKYTFVYAIDAVVKFHLPKSLKEFYYQTSRFLTEKAPLKDSFGKHADKFYSIPLKYKLRKVVENFFAEPIFTIVGLLIYIKFLLPFNSADPLNESGMWHPISSTKLPFKKEFSTLR